MRLFCFVVSLLLVVLPLQATSATHEELRQQIDSMTQASRGPFKRLRWFCVDGEVLPPEPYACVEHGGGFQHGEWTDQVVAMRDQGFYIANLLAGIDPAVVLLQPGGDDLYAQILIERFLMAVDNGWIMRKAQFYRGAIQEEDERDGGARLLRAMAGNERWVTTRYAALRAGASLLPHGTDTASAQQVRQLSAALQNDDPGFASLRAKIHGSPEASDAKRVRDYAARSANDELKSRYAELASLIDEVYSARPLAEDIDELVGQLASDDVKARLRRAADELRGDPSIPSRFTVSAKLLADVREMLPTVAQASDRLALIDFSLKAERENFSSGNAFRSDLSALSRREQFGILRSAVLAAYGTGLLKLRERDDLLEGIDGILAADNPTLQEYQEVVQQLGLAAGWGTQNLRFLYFESMRKLADLDPQSMLFIQDQLRGSPLLIFASIVDGLSRDANGLRGIRHQVFGEEIGTGLKALNPGLANGVLHVADSTGDMDSMRPDGIYLIPETVSDLPPIAGILTEGEGNPLSHVQLLARNLGIPNVSIDAAIAERLQKHDGEQIRLAVSPGGLVEIVAAGPRDGDKAQAATSGSVVIRPEPEKLRLDVLRLIPLDELRPADSGLTVGPKAAKVGGLKAAFPGAVSRGIAIPFGRFKSEVLDRPHAGGEDSVFDWMVAQYRNLDQLTGADKTHQTERFRAELYDTILDTPVSEQFRSDLKRAMEAEFGSEDVGVFIRSDTNVEDLPGFTGAGLNLTLPNVIGFDALVDGISRVWASPFTKRAFAWRQSHMLSPEHVYTSILLLESVASDKSGVLVTEDLDTGNRQVLSVAVNEGVGGAVDGQAAESLRIDTGTGAVKLLSTATAPWRRVPVAGGGISELPASGADYVLTPGEISRLIRFTSIELPERFPPIIDETGAVTAGDIEFGFVDGELRLFQIRPFLQNRNASGSDYLRTMDGSFRENRVATVDLDEVPNKR